MGRRPRSDFETPNILREASHKAFSDPETDHRLPFFLSRHDRFGIFCNFGDVSASESLTKRIRIMNSFSRTALLFAIVLLLVGQVPGQQRYTPYDTLAGLHKSYKPAFDRSFPGWAAMLYRYPVNYRELESAFAEYQRNHPGEKSPVIRYYKMWRAVLAPFVSADGTIVLPSADSQQVSTTKPTQGMKRGGANWTFLGPKETFWLNEQGTPGVPAACPWQANVYSFDVATTNPNILFAGTETGFMNKTTDKGMTWTASGSDHLFGGGITATAIHPTDETIVYVAAGGQIHKTTDGGFSWNTLLTAGNTFSADRLRIDANNPEKIVAATSSGVYISTNGGASWLRPWTKATYDIEIQPGNSNLIYALCVVSGKFAMAVSVDGGVTFNQQGSFPANITDIAGGLLAVTPSDPSVVMAVMLSAANTPYLIRGITTGSTTSWSLIATGQTPAFGMDNGQGYFDLVLEISPIDKNIVFAGTTTLFKSTNGGLQFNAVGGYAGSFAIHPDIQDMRLLPNGETWVATDGGMTLTTDNFLQTSNYSARNNGLIGSDLWGFDQGWNEDVVVGGRYHNGNTAIADFYGAKALRMGGAESPTGWVLSGKSRHVAFNDLGNGWVLPSTAEGKPEGRFIFSKYPNMEEYGGRRSNLVFHPNYFGTIFLGEGTGVWKSTDMGVTYTLLHNFPGQVRFLQISPLNAQVMYVDINGAGLYRTDDGGQSWVHKPALTNGQYGTAYWKGKLFFVISPHDANVVYACLQNGTWSADVGKVFRTADGGDTWSDFTGTLQEYTKCLVIQSDASGGEIVYLFSNSRNGRASSVFYRTPSMVDWEPFGQNYPAGMIVNMALPFFRDGKLRVAGNGGVWESPLMEVDADPIIRPWTEKANYNCMTDTIVFDDHSMLNHGGVTWQWTIDPDPVYISDAGSRNPRVVLGNPGAYAVGLTVTKNGMVYAKNIPDMVTTTTCPSIDDCSNPDVVPKAGWELLYVDSEETNYPGTAVMSFDDDPETIWHTRWSTGSDPYPHEIQVDMARLYKLFDFTYLARQDGENGRIKNYQLYVSENASDWGEPVAEGEFINTAAPQKVTFPQPVVGRYFRLVALSEVNGNLWASAAEFYMTGCTDIYAAVSDNNAVAATAFPVPVTDFLVISLSGSRQVDYTITGVRGETVERGRANVVSGELRLDFSGRKGGVYVLRFINERGVVMQVRVVKP